MSTIWIFDFDGTLVDSAVAIRRCFTKATKELAPDRLLWCEKVLIGPPLPQTAAQILGTEDTDLVQQFIERFKTAYDGGEVLRTPTYPQAGELLETLHARGDTLTIATNKRGKPTRLLIEHLGWSPYFKTIACIDDLIDPNQGKVQLVKNLMNDLTVNSSECVFVGDTASDGKVALHHQIPFIFANYGYGKEDDWSSVKIHQTIHQPIELLKIHV